MKRLYSIFIFCFIISSCNSRNTYSSKHDPKDLSTTFDATFDTSKIVLPSPELLAKFRDTYPLKGNYRLRKGVITDTGVTCLVIANAEEMNHYFKPLKHLPEQAIDFDSFYVVGLVTESNSKVYLDIGGGYYDSSILLLFCKHDNYRDSITEKPKYYSDFKLLKKEQRVECVRFSCIKLNGCSVTKVNSNGPAKLVHIGSVYMK